MRVYDNSKQKCHPILADTQMSLRATSFPSCPPPAWTELHLMGDKKPEAKNKPSFHMFVQLPFLYLSYLRNIIPTLKSFRVVRTWKISGKLDFETFYLYCLACICPHPLCIFIAIKGVNYKKNNQASGVVNIFPLSVQTEQIAF